LTEKVKIFKIYRQTLVWSEWGNTNNLCHRGKENTQNQNFRLHNRKTVSCWRLGISFIMWNKHRPKHSYVFITTL